MPTTRGFVIENSSGRVIIKGPDALQLKKRFDIIKGDLPSGTYHLKRVIREFRFNKPIDPAYDNSGWKDKELTV